MAAYIVAVCEITNISDELKEYAAKSAEITAKHGGEYIVRGPASEVVEGELLMGKSIIITRFPDMEALKAFHHGEEYAAVKHLREGTGTYDIALFEAP